MSRAVKAVSKGLIRSHSKVFESDLFAEKAADDLGPGPPIPRAFLSAQGRTKCSAMKLLESLFTSPAIWASGRDQCRTRRRVLLGARPTRTRPLNSIPARRSMCANA